jgi:hypothetical protein
VATEVVKRAFGAELIRCKISLALDEAESIRGHHVVEVALAPTDRTVALADASELGSNLKTDALTMARALVGLHLCDGRHASFTHGIRLPYVSQPNTLLGKIMLKNQSVLATVGRSFRAFDYAYEKGNFYGCEIHDECSGI